MMKKYLVFYVVAMLMVFTSCKNEANNKVEAKPKKIPLVKVSAATETKMVSFIEITGTVQANVITDIKSAADGVIEALYARENEWVEKDKVIAVVNPNDRLSLISNNQMIVQQLEEQLKTAEGNRQAQIAILEQLEKAKNDLEFAKNMYKTIPVICPMSGLVTRRWVEQGSQVSANESILTISDMNSLVIKADVNEKYFGAINRGKELPVLLNAYPGDTLTGVISLIYPEIDQTTRSVKFDLKIQNFKGKLLPGMMAYIKIPVTTKENAVAVFDEAILTDPNNNKFLFIVNADDIAFRRIVETGITSNRKTEIIKGISAGENVVIEGQEMLKDSMKVKVIGMPKVK